MSAILSPSILNPLEGSDSIDFIVPRAAAIVHRIILCALDPIDQALRGSSLYMITGGSQLTAKAMQEYKLVFSVQPLLNIFSQALNDETQQTIISLQPSRVV